MAGGAKFILQRRAVVVVVLLALGGAGCGSGIDPTPERLDGSQSQEFEQDDLERAAGASDAVEDYCADAVSEAQRIGCESHVSESDLP